MQLKSRSGNYSPIYKHNLSNDTIEHKYTILMILAWFKSRCFAMSGSLLVGISNT